MIIDNPCSMTAFYLRWIWLACMLSSATFAELCMTALWIGPPESHANQWLRYRTSFVTDDPGKPARIRIAADSKYWLWLNGEIMIREGGLKRGPDPFSTYVDTIDLSGKIRPGSNTLAVLLWHFGQNGFSHNSSGSAALYVDGPELGVATGPSWKLSPHPAIQTSPDTPPNRRLPESSILFDARLDQAEWIRCGFDDSSWHAPVTHSAPPAKPWGKLVERPIPQWIDHGILPYLSQDHLPCGTLVAKLPYNAQVNPWMRIEAPAGLEIDIRTDNFMGGSEPNVHAKYITREGMQEFECPGWMNGHEVHYRLPPGVRVLSLGFRETGYDARFSGSFECDDPDLNILWKKAARTLYVTMRDTYMDCPDRERSQWWGDVVNELGEVPYVFDPSAHLLTRKAIRELVDWQRPDGTLYSPVPAGIPADLSRRDAGGREWYTELPIQMLASIGKYGFWTYYIHSGDAETIRHAYPAVRRYLHHWQLDADGLAIHRAGDWDWSDWGENIDARVLDSAWLHLALEGAIEMASLSGAEHDIPRWRALRARLKSGFNRTFWNGTEYRSPGYKGDTDDRANALAILAGFADPGQYPALIRILDKHRNASPWMEKYVLEALYKMNAPDLAMRRMKERYRDQIDSHLSTLWEGWGIGRQGYGGGSYNHAWSGGPLTCLSEFAAGITPTRPGWEAFQIRPNPGALRNISANLVSPMGPVSLEMERNDHTMKLRILCPEKTPAILWLAKELNPMPALIRDGISVAQDFEDPTHWGYRIPGGQSVFETRRP